MSKDTSQYGEGKFILDHFSGRIGRFLDVGAFDGITLSNTWPLSQLGWSGVCVEPSPPAFCHLMRTHEDSENITLVNAAIGLPLEDSPVLQDFYCNTKDCYAADALSSFEQGHVDRFKEAKHPFRSIVIPAIAWRDLERMFGSGRTTFDLINVDVEGRNADVLRAMHYRPEMICVEYDPHTDGERAVHKILESWGYKITEIGGNVLGVRG